MKDTPLAFNSRRAWRKWLIVAALLVMLDQVLKLWVSTATPFGFNYELTPFFSIVHARNSGAVQLSH